MGRSQGIKIGFGAFFVFLGLFLALKFTGDLVSVIGGIFCVALGIGIIASS